MSKRRATFGDFATAATRQLESLPAPVLQHPAAHRHGDAAEVAGSIRAVLHPMTSYTADINEVFSAVPLRQRRSLAPWIRAASRVSEALANAAGYLHPDPGHSASRQDRPRSRTAAALHAAAVSMTAGRDLLHTHTVSRDDGTRQVLEADPELTDEAEIARRIDRLQRAEMIRLSRLAAKARRLKAEGTAAESEECGKDGAKPQVSPRSGALT